MAKTKLNAILAVKTSLIYLLCELADKIYPYLNNKTNPKGNNQNFLNESQDLNTSKKEAQKEQKNIEIAKIAAAKLDFLDTFKANPYLLYLKEDQISIIKRIIYSSLNYETDKINTLKEILKKFCQYVDHKRKPLLIYFLHNTAFFAQKEIENYLKLIQNGLHTLKQNKFELLYGVLKTYLILKKEFAKKLNKAIESCNQNIQNNNCQLAKRLYRNYIDFTIVKNYLEHLT
ncbi:complement regulator-acquiring protein (plasmid) [Borreliella turdi]|uniref:complement regulator-acquiring protein n=1 Tax=Borreliella turdi TaxID=57863 RepID=UPI00264917E2|nr:complement regulator-acquiring protein [Borreliella turdi]WKC77591.1 complement regulator-acquiring protein [Borreliella turdi]